MGTWLPSLPLSFRATLSPVPACVRRITMEWLDNPAHPEPLAATRARRAVKPAGARSCLLMLAAAAASVLHCCAAVCHVLPAPLADAFTGPLPPGTLFLLDERDELLMTLPGVSEDTGFQHCVLLDPDGVTYRYERASRGGLLHPKRLFCGLLSRGLSALVFELLDTPPIPFSPNRQPRRPPRSVIGGLYPGFLPLDGLGLRVGILPPPVRLADALKVHGGPRRELAPAVLRDLAEWGMSCPPGHCFTYGSLQSSGGGRRTRARMGPMSGRPCPRRITTTSSRAAPSGGHSAISPSVRSVRCSICRLTTLAVPCWRAKALSSAPGRHLP